MVAGPIRFILNLLLVSSLAPEDYGIMVIPMMVYSLSQLFVDMGFNSSLIQKAVRKRSHFSSVFFLNLIVALSLGLICCISAPLLAKVYGVPEIEIGIYIISLSLVIRSASLTSEAIIQIRQQFHQLVLIDLICYTVSYSLAIYLARIGYGYKSLLVFALLVSILYTIFVMAYARFIPRKKEFISKYVRVHWRFSRPLIIKSILSNFSTKVDEIVLANLVSVKNIGLYSKGKDLASYIGVFVSKIFSRPLFVILSKNSRKTNTIGQVNVLVINNLYLVVFLLFFLYKIFGLEILIFTLGDQWVGLDPFIPLFIFSILIYIGSVFSSYILLSMALTKKLLIGEVAHIVVKFSLAFVLVIFSYYYKGISELQLLSFFLMTQVIGYCVRMLIQCYYICEKMKLPFVSNFILPLIGVVILFIILNSSLNSLQVNLIGTLLSIGILVIFNLSQRKVYKNFLNEVINS